MKNGKKLRSDKKELPEENIKSIKKRAKELCVKMTLQGGYFGERVLTEGEQINNPKSPVIIQVKLPPLKEKDLISSFKYTHTHPLFKEPNEAIDYIELEISKYIENEEAKSSMIELLTNTVKRNCNIGEMGNAIIYAYKLGQKVTQQLLRKAALRKPSGRNTSAENMHYWGKKIDDYFNECEVKNKSAKTYAYQRVRNEWKKEYPDLSVNPVPSDVTLKKYWDAYKKRKE